VNLAAPFPYFGGKSRVADIVWEHLGNTPNFIEPFFGSGAVLLGRPDSHDWRKRMETINDADGMVSNFWRSVRCDPIAVVHWADWPANENDLHARHLWLVNGKDNLQAKLEGNPDYYDAKIAGWWVWGMSLWIGTGFCSGRGPWRRGENGVIEHRPGLGAPGISRRRPRLTHTGSGIHQMGRANDLESWMDRLADRLRRVRVCCGDWSRICGPNPTYTNGLTGVFLDPPYSNALRDANIYRVDSEDVAQNVCKWALENGDNPLMRIALCGYQGEHEMTPGWTSYCWKTQGGDGSQGDGRDRENADKEIIWFSPHCLSATQGCLWLGVAP
jgi:DNA adenine methylase